MKPRVFTAGGKDIIVTVEMSHKRMINERGFKQAGKPVAGMFARWMTLPELLDSKWFKDVVLKPLQRIATENKGKVFALEIEHSDLIGWTTIALRDGDPSAELRWHEGRTLVTGELDLAKPLISRMTELHAALRAPVVTNAPAPMTRKVTLIGRARTSRGDLLIALLNIRPGMALPENVQSGVARARTRKDQFTVQRGDNIHFWNYGARGDDPNDPFWSYGAIDDGTVCNPLTGKVLYKTELPQEKAG